MRYEPTCTHVCRYVIDLLYACCHDLFALDTVGTDVCLSM